jgi:hypothetical protein
MENNLTIKGSNGIWMTKKEHTKWVQWYDRFWANAIWNGPDRRAPKEDDNVKLAWVIIGDKRIMAGVDNKTMAGYQLEDTMPTWKMPLVPLQYDSFERWCTGMDV